MSKMNYNRIRVAKFGGTSLADAECIKRVAQIIKEDRDRRFVVVSAPGTRFTSDEKVTDLLYKCREDKASEAAGLSRVRERFGLIIEALGVKVDIDGEIESIAKAIARGAKTDYIVSRGEFIIAKILADYIGYEFIDASELISFKGEVLSTSGTNARIKRRLRGCEHAVIPGFYGAREDGSIKVFSRGGSDYSGAIIASGTHAEIYENWTDVDGFRATDPKIIKNAKKISYLTYDEMYRLATMGATVLHPSTVNPLKTEGIILLIKNTFNPSGSGTIISATATAREEELAGIAVKKQEEGDTTFLTLVGYRGQDLLNRVTPIIEKTAKINYISHVSGGDLIIGLEGKSDVFSTLSALYTEFFAS